MVHISQSLRSKEENRFMGGDMRVGCSISSNASNLSVEVTPYHFGDLFFGFSLE